MANELQIQCSSCEAMNPFGRAYCTQCGSSLEHPGWGDAGAPPGAVVDGVWERGGDELIRRVDPDEARRFLGTRTVRIPAGTVGVVLVDGVVDRVLAPGERTSVSLFERAAAFFTGRERTAFYLVDQRPFPVPFVVRTRASAAGEVVKTQVLATFQLPKGDRDALAQFIANVMGARASVAIGDLYNLLRPEVVRVAQAAIERAAAVGDISYPDVEVEIRRQLEVAIARRYGLTVDATLAPLTTVASVNLQLAQLFASDGQELELDLVVRAQGQHDDFTAEAIAPVVGAAAARYLREVAFATLADAAGLRALEVALAPAVREVLGGLGMTLVTLAAIDVRARQQQRERGLAADRAAVDDRERREELARRGVALDVADVERAAALAGARDAAVRVRRRAQVDAELAEARARRETELDLAARAEEQQVAKLRAMAALDRELADEEQARVLARRAGIAGLTPEQMIAMQAAELARTAGGGAAWASALTAHADDERRHAAETRAVYDRAMGAMAEVAASRAAATPALAVAVAPPVVVDKGDA